MVEYLVLFSTVRGLLSANSTLCLFADFGAWVAFFPRFHSSTYYSDRHHHTTCIISDFHLFFAGHLTL